MGAASIDDLLKQDPGALLRSLMAADAAESPVNWELLREVAGARASDAETTGAKKAWARIALRAGALASRAGLLDEELAERQAVARRAKLISQSAVEPGDEILDLDTMLKWFEERVRGLDPGASRPDAEPPLEAMRAARRIKNDLDALGPVVTDPRFGPTEALRTVRLWWDHRDTRP